MAAGYTNIGAKSGNVWRTPKEVHVKVSNGWRECKQVHVKSGNSWRHSWIKSDEVLYTWNSVSTRCWRPQGWRSVGTNNVGSWGFGDHWLLIDWRSATSVSAIHTATGAPATNRTINDANLGRPFINATTIQLHRTGGGNSTINGGGYTFGWNTGGYGSGAAPAMHGSSRVFSSLTSAGWGQNSSRNFGGIGVLGGVADTNQIIGI